MTDWGRIDELFARASDLAEPERSAWLEAECGGDRDLLEQVRSLLTAEAAGAAAIPAMVGRFAETLLEQDPGERVGPYRLREKLGQGGMGVVYLAERDDDEYRQQVALKLVRTPDAAAGLRFRQERQILAALEHPSIARLLDGGTTAQGQPYFVMELVRGATVTEHCAQLQLSQRQRLELFLKICAAVHYAHQRLIIHRDIKPANILVTPEGEPKLLDFGIAKLLDPERLPAGSPLETLTGMRLLTPDYASTEQVRGGPITTATDVYALGLVLFEMLTGKRAQRLSTYSPEEVVRVVCDSEPPRPNLGSDLDNIILMALRKEPERRYASVEQLAADIQRFLDRRPVVARADTLSYRVSRFLSRNRWSVAVAAVLLVATGVGAAVALYQGRLASRRFQQVRRLSNRFLFDFEAEIRRLPGATKAREMVVTTALEYLDGLRGESGGDTTLDRELAAAYTQVGDVQGGDLEGNLGRIADAIKSWDQAIALLERLPADAARDDALTMVHLKRGRARRNQGKAADGLKDMRRAVQLADQRTTPSDARTLSHCLLGDFLFQQLRTDEALAEMKICRDLTVAGARPDGTAIMRYGIALRESGRLEEAAVALQQAVAGLQAQRQAQPNNTRVHRELGTSNLYLAQVMAHEQFANLGRPADALVYSERAAAIYAEIASQDPANQQAAFDYGSQLVANAWVVGVANGRVDEGLARATRAAAVLGARWRTQPGDQNIRGRVGAAHHVLALLWERKNHLPRAIAAATEALRIQDEVAGPNVYKTITNQRLPPRIALARLERLRGRRERARQLLEPLRGVVAAWARNNPALTIRNMAAEYFREGGRNTGDPAWHDQAIALYSDMRDRGVSKSYWEPRLAAAQAELAALATR